MAVRAIDAVQVLHNINLHHRPTPVSEFESGFNNGLNQAMWEITHAPTLTQPNEWVKVMEAINNAAVAYIEGGPYDNDLPGMEFALKIDRLSRDFVRPPEGEEEENDVIEITENL